MVFNHSGLLPLKGDDATIGVALLLWGVLTFYLWIGTFRLNKALFWVFLTLWVTFLLLGFGAILGITTLTKLGGWTGIVSGALAMYTSFAEVTNFCFGHEVVPTGHWNMHSGVGAGPRGSLPHRHDFRMSKGETGDCQPGGVAALYRARRSGGRAASCAPYHPQCRDAASR